MTIHNFIQNNQKLETTQIFFNGWMVKLLYTGTMEWFLSNKNVQTTDTSNDFDES